MAKTTLELLDEVNEAISSVLTGAQEANYEGKKVTLADLDTLKAFRNELVGKATQDKCGGVVLKQGIYGK